MNLHEYQAKQLFASCGIAVPSGIPCFTPTDAAKAALERLGDAGLVDLETADLVRADAAVVVGAPVSGGVVERRDLVARRFASLAAAQIGRAHV